MKILKTAILTLGIAGSSFIASGAKNEIVKNNQENLQNTLSKEDPDYEREIRILLRKLHQKYNSNYIEIDGNIEKTIDGVKIKIGELIVTNNSIDFLIYIDGNEYIITLKQGSENDRSTVIDNNKGYSKKRIEPKSNSSVIGIVKPDKRKNILDMLDKVCEENTEYKPEDLFEASKQELEKRLKFTTNKAVIAINMNPSENINSKFVVQITGIKGDKGEEKFVKFGQYNKLDSDNIVYSDWFRIDNGKIIKEDREEIINILKKIK